MDRRGQEHGLAAGWVHEAKPEVVHGRHTCFLGGDSDRDQHATRTPVAKSAAGPLEHRHVTPEPPEHNWCRTPTDAPADDPNSTSTDPTAVPRFRPALPSRPALSPVRLHTSRPRESEVALVSGSAFCR